MCLETEIPVSNQSNSATLSTHDRHIAMATLTKVSTNGNSIPTKNSDVIGPVKQLHTFNENWNIDAFLTIMMRKANPINTRPLDIAKKLIK